MARYVVPVFNLTNQPSVMKITAASIAILSSNDAADLISTDGFG
jgi:hypothetical protein